MEKLKDRVMFGDPADCRPPSELSIILDDHVDVEPFHQKPARKLPLEKEAKEKMFNSLENLNYFYPTDFLMLMYAFMHDSKLDLKSITDADMDPRVKSVSMSDFKSITAYARIYKLPCDLTHSDLEESAEQLTKSYGQYKIGGPFLMKNYDETYTIIDPEYLEEGLCYHYSPSYRYALVMVCPWQAMFLNVFPEDFVDTSNLSHFQSDRIIRVEKRDCIFILQRMVGDILLGYVNDMATSQLFRSQMMREEFFKTIETENKVQEVFTRIDKLSRPSRPKTFLYCLVANANPNLEFLSEVLIFLKETSLPDEEKKLQIHASFMAACQWGHVLIYEKLSRMVEKTYEMLRRSIFGGNADILQIILREHRWTQSEMEAAMEWACFCGNGRAVSLFQDFGIRFSNRCLYEVVCGGNLELFLEVCRHAGSLDETFKDGQTALHAAAERGYFGIVEFLVQRGCVDVNVVNDNCDTALQLAVKNCHIEVAEILLDGGAKADHRDAFGATPLHKACALGELHLVGRLLTSGCDINALDSDGRSLLHDAAIGGNIKVVLQLVQLGHKVDVFDKKGRSVVDYASSQGHSDIVTYFVSTHPALFVQDSA